MFSIELFFKIHKLVFPKSYKTMVKYYSPQSIERISRLHRLIQDEITGIPRELAFKFNVSERTIYLMIDWLKDYGAMIKYDRKRKTYFYFKPFDIKINFSIECISDEGMKKINGGHFNFPARILQGTTFSLLQH